MNEQWVELVQIAANEYPNLSEIEKQQHDLAFRTVGDLVRCVGDTAFLAMSMFVLSKYTDKILFPGVKTEKVFETEKVS
jgi:hypothetical protein